MPQIKRKKTVGQIITGGISSPIILTIAICVLLASFAGFNQGKAFSFNPCQGTPLPDRVDNPAPDLFWQGERVSLNFTIAAMLTTASRLPIKHSHNGCNTRIAHPLPVNAKFLNITPSSVVGGAVIPCTTADVCICLFIDLPPPCHKA